MEKSLVIRELQTELDRDLAQREASAQELSRVLLEKIEERNPQLMDLKVEAIHEIRVNMVFGDSPVEGVLLKYLQEERTRICSEICSHVEESTGRPISIGEIDSVLALPLCEIERLDQLVDRAKVVDVVRRGLLNRIYKNIPMAQTMRPNIQICIYVPANSGARIFVYAESLGSVIADEVIELPTVTLDTNVVREWWDCRGKVDLVEKLLELSNSLKIDLAVTGRIRDDVPLQPLAGKINDLSNLTIDEIGSVIRFSHWKAGRDVAGTQEFENFRYSPAIVNKLEKMNEKRRPDWRDWDHLHTHFRYGRDYFLTWDKGILDFSDELKSQLGINVMEPERFLSRKQYLPKWAKKQGSCSYPGEQLI